VHTVAVGVLGALCGAALCAFALAPVRRTRRAAAVPVVIDESAAALRAAFEVFASGVVLVDGADSVVLVNPAAAALNVGRGGRLVIPALARMVAQTRRTGVPQHGELVDPVLSEQTAVLAHTVLAGSSGHVVVTLEDITDARRLDAVRRDFVANVSHELKTPVGGLSLLAEAAFEAADDPPAVRHFTRSMSREAARLARLVQELIDLSRIQGGEPLPEPATVRVADLVSDAVERARLNADAKHIAIVVGDLSGLSVWGDARQLATACANLLDNAVAYSPDDTRVAIGAKQVDGEVDISVADQGIGIAPDDRDRIFERFYRADPARSRATGGTGLGLAIVKHIVGNHGGRVSVWSDEGRGSTFTLHLPAAPTDVHVANRSA
jgi:two-component system sensor histidine kinase SenX3